MIKRVLLAVLLVLGVLATLAFVKISQFKAMGKAGAAMAMPTVTVTSTEVREETWKPTIAAIGSITAVQGVTVRAELAGVVREIGFESGVMVKKGELLVQLDVGTEQAQLKAAEADAELTRLELERARDLGGRKVISQSEWDTAEAKHKQATAQVQNIKELIEKKTIRAPFAGRLGIRHVNIGQVINPGDPVVSLQSLDPVFADFTLPQQRLAVLKAGMSLRVTSDSFPGQDFNGTLTAVNPDVDPQTRSVSVQGTLENSQELLRPGMFVKVEVVLPEDKTARIVPETAIAYAPYGDSVFVIESKNDEATGKPGLVLRQQFVRLGDRRGDFVEVVSGLESGQKVVSAGVFKMRNGSPVVVDNSLAPEASLTPKPGDS